MNNVKKTGLITCCITIALASILSLNAKNVNAKNATKPKCKKSSVREQPSQKPAQTNINKSHTSDSTKHLSDNQLAEITRFMEENTELKAQIKLQQMKTNEESRSVKMLLAFQKKHGLLSTAINATNFVGLVGVTSFIPQDNIAHLFNISSEQFQTIQKVIGAIGIAIKIAIFIARNHEAIFNKKVLSPLVVVLPLATHTYMTVCQALSNVQK